MPTVYSPAKVLVTGATGFIGSWTVRAYLERGYDVRGTVRSKAKGEWLAGQEWVKAASSKFEYAIVEDIEKAGAFDEAVKDITVVVHTASPVTFAPKDDPSEIINPAVNGTLGVLNSALKNGNSVKRVVITSSVVALLEPTKSHRVFTEGDWNSFSVNEVESKGHAADPFHIYCASKVKAEQAAWAFVEQHKGKLGFEVTTILPVYIYGPIIHEVASPDKLNVSIKGFYDSISKEVPSKSLVENNSFVDVRDVAAMHVDVVEADKAAGERFIASGGVFNWQDVYDILNARPDPISGIPVGTPRGRKTVPQPTVFSNDKAKKILGFKFRSLEEMSYDTVMSLRDRGF